MCVGNLRDQEQKENFASQYESGSYTSEENHLALSFFRSATPESQIIFNQSSTNGTSDVFTFLEYDGVVVEPSRPLSNDSFPVANGFVFFESTENVIVGCQPETTEVSLI